jgi:hypothetical protein
VDLWILGAEQAAVRELDQNHERHDEQLSNDVASLDFPASLELHVVLDGCHTVDIACDLDRPVDVVS